MATRKTTKKPTAKTAKSKKPAKPATKPLTKPTTKAKVKVQVEPIKQPTIQPTIATTPTETIHQAGEAFLLHLKNLGKNERTVYTYGRDLLVIESYFGADLDISQITPDQVTDFLTSDQLHKLPNGKPKAKPTIDKTKRLLRFFLVWAQLTNRVEKAPLPEALPMGYSGKDGVLKGVNAADPNRKPRRKKGEPTDLPTEPAVQPTEPEGASDGPADAATAAE